MSDDQLIDPYNVEVGKRTFRQFQENVRRWLVKEYNCTLQDASDCLGPYNRVYLDHVRELLLGTAQWVPPARWVNAFKRDFPEYWMRRLMHDHPPLLDRLAKAGLEALLIPASAPRPWDQE